jgi:hypothetical protein
MKGMIFVGLRRNRDDIGTFTSVSLGVDQHIEDLGSGKQLCAPLGYMLGAEVARALAARGVRTARGGDGPQCR